MLWSSKYATVVAKSTQSLAQPGIASYWLDSFTITEEFAFTIVPIVNTKTKLKIKQGKKSYKSGYKKAIITLKKGQSIDLTTGI